jgi:hypothetical protein
MLNKFDSWILVLAGLTLKERHQLENTHFICIDHKVLAVIAALSDDIKELEKGVVMNLPDHRPVVVVVVIQYITADNARHSEIASSKGAMS